MKPQSEGQPLHSSRRGFTLIELLVVIAIIAILAAILSPVFAKARDKARQASCASNMKQLALALTQYTQDNDESYPMGWEMWHWGGDDAPPLYYNWIYATQPYIKSLSVLGCPSDTKALQVDGQGVQMSYGINANDDNNSQFEGNIGIIPVSNPWGWGSTRQPQTLAHIKRPAESVLLAERHADDSDNKSGVSYEGEFTGRKNPDMPYGSEPAVGNDGDVQGGWFNIPWGKAPAAPAPNGPNGGVNVSHSGVANIAFVDGHVKAMHPVDTNPDPAAHPELDMWNVIRP